MTLVDADQHILEPPTMWADHMAAGNRDGALAIIDDGTGNEWLTWGGERIALRDPELESGR